MMKNLITSLLAFTLISGLNAQNTDSIWIVNNYTKIERMIPMRDGVKLFTSIYVPRDISEDHPILIERSPYSCAPYGEGAWRDFWNRYLKYYLFESYIMVKQDVRGRWMSEGEFVDIRPFIPDKKDNNDIDESSDVYDTIEWLLKNIPHNNGKVGVFGISYPGFYSTMAAASNHPALKAVSPQAPVTNWFIGDDFHHNGAFFLLDAFGFYPAMGAGFGLPRPKPSTKGPETIRLPFQDNYRFFLETGTLAAFARLAGDSVRFWKELYSHPDYDEWWKVRDARNATKNLNPAMLWVGGHFDAEDNWGAWNSYKAAEENNPMKEFNRIVMGPWAHGQWSWPDGSYLGNIGFGSNTSQWYQQNIEIPFFNYYLKGKGSKPEIAEATIFITGRNEWREFGSWPPAGTVNTDLFLQPSGRLGWQRPGSGPEHSDYISDPSKPVPYTGDVHFFRTMEYMTDDQRFASRRPDVLVFKTDILEEEITLTGMLTADLFVSLSSTDADFVVKLIDVFPDDPGHLRTEPYSVRMPFSKYPGGGYEMLVHGEIFRGRYRNSFEKPAPFVPGKVERVKFEVGNVAHTFKKGHRIMIQIQSSWFPLADRNPQKFVNIYEARESDFQKATIQIYHSKKYPGKIILPVLTQ